MGRPVSHPPISLRMQPAPLPEPLPAASCSITSEKIGPKGLLYYMGGFVALRTRETTHLLGVRTPSQPFKSPAAPAPRQQHKHLD